ncbi:MAG TPA: PAS domain S-box protein [Acidobacteriota bacterium]
MTKSRLFAYVLAVIASIAAFLLTESLLRFFRRDFFFISIAAVSLTALYGGLGPAMLAIGLTGLGIAYLLFYSAYSPLMGSTDEIVALGIYILVALLTSALAGRREQAERKSNEQREWLQVILHSVADGVIVSDPDGHITFMNAMAEQVTGWKEEEARKKKLDEVFRSEPPGSEPAAGASALSGSDQRLNKPTTLIRKDGTPIPVEHSSAPIRDDQGTALGTALVLRDISDRKKAEDQLQESEQRFRMMADTAPVLIWMCGPDALCTFFNRTWLDFRGASPDNELGTGWQRAIHSEDLGRFQKTFHSSVRARKQFSAEFRLKRADGSYRWMQATGVPLLLASGEFGGFIGICLDVNDFKEAQEEIGKSRDHLNVILNGLSDGVTVQDRSGKLVFANEAAIRSSGFPSMNAMLEAEPSYFMDQFELRDELGRLFRWEELPGKRVLRGEDPPPTVIRVQPRANGEEAWMLIKSSPIRDASGQIQFAVNIFHDITARRRADEAQLFLAEASILLASSLNYEETLSSLARLAVPRLADWCAIDILEHGARLRRLAVAHADPEKVKWALDLEKRFPAGLEDPLGVPKVIRTARSEMAEEVPDTLLVEIAGDEEHLRLLRELGLKSYMCVPMVARGNVLGAITFVSAESGRRYKASDLRFVEDLAGRAAVAVDNAGLYREAQEANRLKDEFLATLSHELRTPLNAVLGWAHMLRTGRLDEATSARAFESIERNAQSQAQLIADILDVSRIITGKLRLDIKATRLTQVIESAIDSVRPAATAKGIPITSVLDASVDRIPADPDRLQQVVWNLLSNALKFTSKDGTVEVRLERHHSQAQITVHDTGTGIAPEFLPFVFDRFRQAESSSTRPHGGLGLGLAIVRHLVELHGGTVEAHSPGLGMGSTFEVRLPVQAVTETAGSPVVGGERDRRHTRFPNLKDVKVLVVDDEADAREVITTVLEQQGAKTQSVGSVAEAMVEMQRFKPDVLISDIGMPGEDGYVLIRKVRALQSDQGGRIPAAALTAYARVEDRTQVLEAGFQTHVTKPVEPDELVAVVADLARKT